MIDFEGLWAHVSAQFPLGPYSLHGPSHWQRVEANGLRIAQGSGADVKVVRLFAVFHDSRRVNDGTDDGHGRRGAELAAALRGRLFELPDDAFGLLVEACEEHELGRVSADPTIGACWDADRLDLPRVGITPAPRFMSTAPGKAEAARLTSRPGRSGGTK